MGCGLSVHHRHCISAGIEQDFVFGRRAKPSEQALYLPRLQKYGTMLGVTPTAVTPKTTGTLNLCT